MPAWLSAVKQKLAAFIKDRRARSGLKDIAETIGAMFSLFLLLTFLPSILNMFSWIGQAFQSIFNATWWQPPKCIVKIFVRLIA